MASGITVIRYYAFPQTRIFRKLRYSFRASHHLEGGDHVETYTNTHSPCSVLEEISRSICFEHAARDDSRWLGSIYTEPPVSQVSLVEVGKVGLGGHPQQEGQGQGKANRREVLS